MGPKGANVPLLLFLSSMWQGGRVQVSRPAPQLPGEAASVRQLLQEIDASRRLELPGKAPPLDLPAAEWAGEMLHAACQFLVHRDLPAELVAERLAQPCPVAPSPSVCYSVDLTFATLPDVISLARGIAVNDPLTVGLTKLAVAWPLSSVGVPEAASADVSAFVDDDCLARLYVDRVIQRRDLKRLDHPRVRRLAGEAIGPYTDLAPLVAAEIEGEFL
jgi:hypothetical protein